MSFELIFMRGEGGDWEGIRKDVWDQDEDQGKDQEGNGIGI